MHRPFVTNGRYYPYPECSLGEIENLDAADESAQCENIPGLLRRAIPIEQPLRINQHQTNL